MTCDAAFAQVITNDDKTLVSKQVSAVNNGL
jgi:hypothetical protein